MTIYFVVAWLIAYVAKKNLENWVLDVNEVRCMLFIESNYVFIWIVSSVLFTTAA